MFAGWKPALPGGAAARREATAPCFAGWKPALPGGAADRLRRGLADFADPGREVVRADNCCDTGSRRKNVFRLNLGENRSHLGERLRGDGLGLGRRHRGIDSHHGLDATPAAGSPPGKVSGSSFGAD